MSKIKVSIQSLGHCFMLGKFLAVVIGHSMHSIRDRAKQANDDFSDKVSDFLRHLGNLIFHTHFFLWGYQPPSSRYFGWSVSEHFNRCKLRSVQILYSIGGNH